MRHILLIALQISLFPCCFSDCQSINQPLKENISRDIKINQLGYFPSGKKVFCVANSVSGSFIIVNHENKAIYQGKLKNKGYWGKSGEQIKTGEFTSINKPGKYYIAISDKGNSHAFEIKNGLYKDVATDATRSYYFQRASMCMDEEFLGKFTREKGHPDDTCYYHPSSGYTDGFRSSPGGWYDAGDYGKYIVNASITVSTLLALHEKIPKLFTDNSLNIPESGNGINDLLDELRYELKWMLTMQDNDGGVFHKLTPREHDAYLMPANCSSKRYIIGKSTAASLDFSATMAQAARIYKPVDPGFAMNCLSASKNAFKWAKSNPAKYFNNPDDIFTGEYKDTILKEEFFWANAELYCTTKQEKFFFNIKDKIGNIKFRYEESWRNYVDNLGYYSLLSSNTLPDDNYSLLQEGLIKLANKLAERIEKNPYRVPINRFAWGSNSDIGNAAIVFIYAFEESGEKKYLDYAVELTDYFFGKNATAYSFVSGYGSKPVKNLHHRLFIADGIDEPYPGFIAGGPNSSMQDKGWMKSLGISYPDTFPAKAFIDSQESYASNEVCINWNAPLVFVLAYLDYYFSKLK